MEFAVLSGLAGNAFCVMITSAANELVFSIDDNAINGRRANLQEFVSERHTFLQQWCEKKVLKFGATFSLFYTTSVGFEMYQ